MLPSDVAHRERGSFGSTQSLPVSSFHLVTTLLDDRLAHPDSRRGCPLVVQDHRLA